MIVISIFNHKGGVGKTLTSVNVAAALGSKFNKLVLLLDLDPQGNATSTFGINPDELEQEKSLAYAIYTQAVTMVYPDRVNILQSPEEILKSCTIPIPRDNIYIAPGNHWLANRPLHDMVRKHVSAIKELLSELPYEYVIIDTKGNDDEMMDAAFYASDGVIIPTEPSRHSFDGIVQTIMTVSRFKQDYDTPLDVFGIVLNSKRGKPDKKEQEIFDGTRMYCEEEKIKVYKSIIPYSKMAANSIWNSKSVINYYRGNPAEVAFTNLTREIIVDTEIIRGYKGERQQTNS